MDNMEREFLEAEDTKPGVWLRYIGDIFFIWAEGENKLKSFLQCLNTFHANLNFTHDKSKTSINFLDAVVRIHGDKFETDLYSKPTDCHQFLEFNSAHPIHIKKSIGYSQGLSIKRLCSTSVAFEKHLESIRSWFGKRGYPKKPVDNQLRRVVENRPEQLPEHQTKHGTGVPLVFTYHPRFHGKIIRKTFIYLYAEQQVKQVFTLAPFVLFQSGFSLRNHLVQAKVYPLLREKGSSCCEKSRCETCFKIKETNTFQSFVTKKIYKINHHFHCDSKCIVYLLSCKVCGLQYVGSTVDRFHLRWNNYKCSQRAALEGATPK